MLRASVRIAIVGKASLTRVLLFGAGLIPVDNVDELLAPLLAALHKPKFLSSETQEYREILTELIARSGLTAAHGKH
jgi:hypothetical protein